MSGGADRRSLPGCPWIGVLVLAIALTAATVAGAQATPPPPEPGISAEAEDAGEAAFGAPASIAVGEPWDGSLLFGVKLPAQGEDFFTWDFALKRRPSRAWRRWSADGTQAIVLGVLREFRLAHPEAPRIGIADLSRPRGGKFGRRFGGLGHASHQNGLDADILYPRLDRRERRAKGPAQIDRALAQDLVRRLVRAGAEYVFVGLRIGLRGPKAVVQPLTHHDDHMHVRLPPELGAPGASAPSASSGG